MIKQYLSASLLAVMVGCASSPKNANLPSIKLDEQAENLIEIDDSIEPTPLVEDVEITEGPRCLMISPGGLSIFALLRLIDTATYQEWRDRVVGGIGTGALAAIALKKFNQAELRWFLLKLKGQLGDSQSDQLGALERSAQNNFVFSKRVSRNEFEATLSNTSFPY